MIIRHLAAPTALHPRTDAVTALCGQNAQVLDNSSYQFMKLDLHKSQYVHHVIVEGVNSNCADCVDIQDETTQHHGEGLE